MDKILIYGKDTWPFTNAAREAYQKKNIEVEYINVIDDPSKLEEMLKHSKGKRKVPVILEGNTVILGHDGKSWGI